MIITSNLCFFIIILRILDAMQMKIGRALFEKSARCLVLYTSVASAVATLQMLPMQWSQAHGITIFVFQGGRPLIGIVQIIALVMLSPLMLLMESYLLLLMLREINQAPSIWHWRSFRKPWPWIPILLGVSLPIVLLELLGIGLQFR